MILLEDLHRADDATFDLLTYAARRLTAERVLVIASFRTDDARADTTIWEHLRRLDAVGLRRRLTLNRLSADETGELVRRGLGLPAPAPLFETRIFQSTAGNPLFVLETLRTLYAEGMLTQDEHGTWHTPWDDETVDYAELPLPSAVEGTILRRLERLKAAERTVLGLVAVLNDDVEFPLLKTVYDGEGRDLVLTLGALVRGGFLQELPDAYRFTHDAIRQIVYETLPDEERSAYHRRAAGAIEEMAPERVEELAYHYDAGGVADTAVYYHRRAGDRAAATPAGRAYTTALDHYDRAIELAGEVTLPADLQFDLLAAREATLHVLGRRAQQATDLASLTALAGDDPVRLREVYRRRAWLCAYTGRYDDAEAAAAQMLALAREAGNRPTQATALIVLGTARNWRETPAEAVEPLQRAVVMSREAGDTALEADAQAALASALLGMAEYETAETAAHRALRLREDIGDELGQAEVLATLGIIYMEQGELDGAESCYRRALELNRTIGLRYGEGRTLLNLDNIQYVRGHIGAAIERYEAGVTIFREIGSRRGEVQAALNMASARLNFVGDTEAIRRCAEDALEYARETGVALIEGQALNLLGTLALRRSDLDDARRHLDAGMAALDISSVEWMKAQAYHDMVVLSLAEGDPERALAEVTAAEELCRAFGLADLLTDLRSLRSEVLLALGRPDEALAATGDAVARLTPGVIQDYLVHFRHYRVLDALGRAADAHATLPPTRGRLSG